MDPIQFGFTATNLINDRRVDQDDINYIKKWVLDEPIPKITDEQIGLFLLSCENNLEATKTTIRAFFSIRNGNPKIFTGRDVENKDVKKGLETIDILTTFEKRTNDNYSIIFGRLRDTRYSNFELATCVKVVFMAMDAMIHDNPPNGFIVVFDMKDIGFMHLTRLLPSVLLPFFKYVQEALPTRLVAVHVLNSNYLVTALMKILTPFMNADLISKLNFHPPSIDKKYFFEKYVGKSVMPEEYGGDLPSVNELRAKSIEKFIEMKTHFEAEEKQRLSYIKQNKDA